MGIDFWHKLQPWTQASIHGKSSGQKSGGTVPFKRLLHRRKRDRDDLPLSDLGSTAAHGWRGLADTLHGRRLLLLTMLLLTAAVVAALRAQVNSATAGQRELAHAQFLGPEHIGRRQGALLRGQRLDHEELLAGTAGGGQLAQLFTTGSSFLWYSCAHMRSCHGWQNELLQNVFHYCFLFKF